MASIPLGKPAELSASDRLDRVRSGPPSARRSSPSAFEQALLQVWHPEAPLPEALRCRLSHEQLAALEALRSRTAQAARVRNSAQFAAALFHALPFPVLASGPEGLLWNAAFGEQLERERALPSRARRREPVIRRFERLLVHDPLRLPGLFVLLGARAWWMVRVDFAEARETALYFSPLDADLSALPPPAREVALLEVSGLAHKEIAVLCGKSKSHVDHLCARHRTAISQLRSSLCRVAPR